MKTNIAIVWVCVLVICAQISAVGGQCVNTCTECLPTSIAVLNGTQYEIEVTTSDDIINAEDGLVSLREAFIVANYVGGTVLISISPGTTYTLSIPGRDEDFSCTGDLDVYATSNITSLTLTVVGGESVIDGNFVDRIFDITKTGIDFKILASSSGLYHVTIQNGYVTSASPLSLEFGGALRHWSPDDLQLVSVNFVSNRLEVPINCDTDFSCGAYGGAIGINATRSQSLSTSTIIQYGTYSNNTVVDSRGGTMNARMSYGGAIGGVGFPDSQGRNIVGLECVFENNTAERGGGAIGLIAMTMAENDCNYTTNHVIYTAGGNSTVQPYASGGAIMLLAKTAASPAYDTSRFSSNGANARPRFVGNTATMDGGAIALLDAGNFGVYNGIKSGVTLVDVDLIGNQASRRGGAVCMDRRSSLTTFNSVFEDNVLGTNPYGPTEYGDHVGGGAIAVSMNSTQNSVRTRIVNNYSRGLGGGMLFAGQYPTRSAQSSFTVSTCFIANNTALGGGGIYMSDTMIVFTINEQTTISGNVASGNNSLNPLYGNGGGVFASIVDRGFTIEDTTISGNSASNDGAGFWWGKTPDTTSITTIKQSTVSGNIAGRSGGGVVIAGANDTFGFITIASSAIVFNQALGVDGGGGLVISTPSPTFSILFTYSIISDNSCPVSNASTISPDFRLVSYTGDIISLDYNLIGNQNEILGVSDFSFPLPGDLANGSSPNLAPLSDNGGGVLTHMPLACSLVRNKGQVSALYVTDQRGIGFPGILEGSVDIGPIETLSPLCGPDEQCVSYACTLEGFCVGVPLDGVSCDDGITDGSCQNQDMCVVGVCVSGGNDPSNCMTHPNYGIDCLQGCDNSTFECSFISNGTVCDDGLEDPSCRPQDICQNGICLPSTQNNETLCYSLPNFGNDCLVGCNSTGECVFSLEGELCDSGFPYNSCRNAPICVAGTCFPGLENNETLCELLQQYGSDCFTGCDINGDCVFIPNGDMCNDGIPGGTCQDPDICVNGTCTTVLTPDITQCQDLPQYGTDCFVGCNSTTLECVFIPNTEPCDDGIANGSCQNPDLCSNGTCIAGTLNATLCQFLPQYGTDCFIGCNSTTMECEFYQENTPCTGELDPGRGSCQDPKQCQAGTCVTGSENQGLCELLPSFGVDCFIGCSLDEIDCMFTPNGSVCDNGVDDGDCRGQDVCLLGTCAISAINETLCEMLPRYGIDCFEGCTITGSCDFALNGSSCNDSNNQTVSDICVSGTCSGTPGQIYEQGCGVYLCDPDNIPDSCVLQYTNYTWCEGSDRNTCTRDYCHQQTGQCLHEPYPDGKHCYYWEGIDFIPPNPYTITSCTTADVCVSGVCVRGPDNICGPCSVQAGTDVLRIGVLNINVSISAGFFDVGSDIYEGPLEMRGHPLEFFTTSMTPLPNPYEIHAIIERLNHARMDSPSGNDTVPVSVVEVSLVSTEEFVPEFFGIPSLTGWSVSCHLSNSSVGALGNFTLTASGCSCAEGGVFTVSINGLELDCEFWNPVTQESRLLQGVGFTLIPNGVPIPWYGNLDPLFGGQDNVTSLDILTIDRTDVFIDAVYPSIANGANLPLHHGQFYPGVRFDKCETCDFFSMCQEDFDCDDGNICTTDTCRTNINPFYEPIEVRTCVNAYDPQVGTDCYFGPPQTMRVGECVPGVLVCSEITGTLDCVGMIIPFSGPDIPGDHIDTNCDGDPDS